MPGQKPNISTADNTETAELYLVLKSQLAASSGKQRKHWAAEIAEKHIDLKHLSGLLKGEPKTATRFLWMLSDVGLQTPDKLMAFLPFLWQLCDPLKPAYKMSFASFWLYAGVPAKQEGLALDHLFHWLTSAETNVTTKSRAMLVLFKLTGKYPELKNELSLSISEQMYKHSKDFEKRAEKILLQLNR